MRGQNHHPILQREDCNGRGEETCSPLPGLSVLAPHSPKGAHFPDDHTNDAQIFTQSSYTVKKGSSGT